MLGFCGEADCRGREPDAHISSMLRSPTVVSLAARLAAILQSPGVQNSLLAGKNAGNFRDSAFFLRNPSPNQVRNQLFARKFPKRRAGNYFACAGN
jgi:hypothetical protein